MHTRIILVPYKKGSRSCKELQNALRADGLKCYRKLPPYLAKATDLVVYYGGNARIGDPYAATLNEFRAKANNKLSCLLKLEEHGLPIVPYTREKEVAKTWKTIVCRHILTGHSGNGIEIKQQGEELPNCPLYTQYIKKTYECRVHIFNGQVIDAQIKRKVADYNGERNTAIRNIHTGWVYCREDFILAVPAADLAVAAVAAVGLNFGAVDLIYNQHHNQFYILEINTAPGLEGTTLINYKEAIKNAATY